MSFGKDKPVLVEEKLALTLFLDSLLHEPADVAIVDTEVTTEVEAKVKVETVVDMLAVEPVAEVKTETEIEVEPEIISSVVEEPALVTTSPRLAQEETDSAIVNEFQVMLFKVAGLTLAVPLDGLSGVVEWNNDLAEMPGHADFYLGILHHLGQRIPVVDTASLVFPADKLKSLAVAKPEDRITRIVLIDEGRWGLAVDSVEEVIILQGDQVRWRSERTQRKWLLGTVVEHMCALIDPTAFAEKLTSGED